MNFTDNAKKVFLTQMDKVGMHILHLGLIPTGEGTSYSIDIRLVKEEDAKRIIDVNGVSVDIDEASEIAMEGFTFDGDEEGRLLLRTPHHCGGGCCGHHGKKEEEGGCCGHHGEDHECCGGEGHKEGECCCGGEGCCGE